MLELARRRRLTFRVREYNHHYFGNVDTYNFADLTEEHLTNKQLRQSLQALAVLAVERYFRKSLGFCPEIEQPYAPDFKNVLVVWSNYDMHVKYRAYDSYIRGAQKGGWKKIRRFLQEAMNECLPAGSEPSRPMWWWATEDPVSVTRHSRYPVTDDCLVAFRPNIP